MSRRTPALLLLFAVLAAPAAAQAAPAPANLGLQVGQLKGGKAKVFSRVPVSGALRPFVPGQEVELLFFRNGRQVGSETLEVRSGPGDKGVFETRFLVRRGGRFAVQAVHGATPGQAGAATPREKFGVRFPAIGRGQCGRVVRRFKRNLSKLGYVPGGGSCMSDRAGRAVLAYRKVNGQSKNQHAGAGVVKRVFAGEGGFRARRRNAGAHVEVSISKQVLAFVNKRGKVVETYPVSTGKSSTPTVRGRFKFYRRQPGYNSKRMYYSTYFIGGYAIHGFDPVPTFPASHGCVRVPIADALHIYRKISLGDTIFVY